MSYVDEILIIQYMRLPEWEAVMHCAQCMLTSLPPGDVRAVLQSCTYATVGHCCVYKNTPRVLSQCNILPHTALLCAESNEGAVGNTMCEGAMIMKSILFIALHN